MGNVKCENMFKHVQSNVGIATNEFASNLTANILFFSLTLNKLFMKSFLFENLCFAFYCSSGL